MQIIGPTLNERAQCEEVLRSLPMWFGIEQALVMFADDSVRLPTFAAVESTKIIGFISLLKHFPHAWEVHCIAVRAESRNKGYGKALMAHTERWLAQQGVSLLQVKTVAATSASKEYALRAGLNQGEFFPEYLPTVSLTDGRCIGAEALIRWRRATGVVAPWDFIPVAENTPLSGLITYWAINNSRTSGARIALDDVTLGGGANLAVLARCNLHIVKIDMHLVSQISPQRPSPEWLDGIAALVQAAGLEVVAEGVETEQQMLVLRTANIQSAQGFDFSHLIPAADFIAHHQACIHGRTGRRT